MGHEKTFWQIRPFFKTILEIKSFDTKVLNVLNSVQLFDFLQISLTPGVSTEHDYVSQERVHITFEMIEEVGEAMDTFQVVFD